MPDAAPAPTPPPPAIDLEATFEASGIGPVLEQLDRELVGLKAMGRVLFIDEAYYLYRPENECDYGQEAIEILLQVMENRRADLVVVLAGYADRMDCFFTSNPGFRSRIAHHIDFPDYDAGKLMRMAELMLANQNYRFSPDARDAFARYLEARMRQPHFANARSVRNALDRPRLRQAVRLFEQRGLGAITAEDLMTIGSDEILASRVLANDASEGQAA